MKRRVIIEFDTTVELEDMDIHYKGDYGAIQIAQEMIIRAVLSNQSRTIAMANAVSSEHGDDHSKYLLRFDKTIESLKIVGYITESDRVFVIKNGVLQTM